MKPIQTLSKSFSIGCLAVGAAAAHAIVTFDYEVVVTGDMPGGSVPWATLVIMNDGPNQVDMTLTHNASSAAGQFISKLLLNIEPFVSDVAIVENSPKITGAAFGQNAFNDAGARFDVKIKFETSNAGGGINRLKPGESVSWKITGTGITESHFDAFSNGLPLKTLLHIQGIAGGLSSKVTIVPEPATIMAFAVAFGGLLLRKRRK